MKKEDRWWSAPLEGEKGGTVIVTGRDHIGKQMESGKYPYLIKIGWDYNAMTDGMPEPGDAALIGRVHDALLSEFDRDGTALMVGVYTGDGRRDWIMYARSLGVFNKVLNRALEDIETVPIVVEASSDPGWEEYREMRELSYVPEEDEE